MRSAQVKNDIAGASSGSSSFSLILCDHFDGDAISASRLFQSVFVQKGIWLEDQDLSPDDYAEVVRAGKPQNAVFVFSQNTHKSIVQLSRLGLLFASQPEMHMVPVAVGDTFEFPDADFLEKLETGKTSVFDLSAETERKLAGCAGGQVTLRQRE